MVDLRLLWLGRERGGWTPLVEEHGEVLSIMDVEYPLVVYEGNG